MSLQTMIVVEELLKFRVAIIDIKKSIIHIDSVLHVQLFASNMNLIPRCFSSNEISNILSAYISKLVLRHLSTSSTTVFIIFLGRSILKFQQKGKIFDNKLSPSKLTILRKNTCGMRTKIVKRQTKQCGM